MKAKAKIVRRGDIVENRYYCGQPGCRPEAGAKRLAFIPTGKPLRCHNCNRKIQE